MGRDTNFAYSFLALSPDRRHAITAVWDFCRAVDDEVDEHDERPLAERRAGLQRWRDEVAACFEGGQPQTPQGEALQAVTRAFPVARLPFDQLIDGCAMDLEPVRFQSFCELRAYCYKVASTVGLICIEVFGYRNPGTRQYAEELGLALQLTNILRDLDEDAAIGRLYLPREELAAAGIPASLMDDPAAVIAEPRVDIACHALAHEAQAHFAGAERVMRARPRGRLMAPRLMGAVYRRILDRMLAQGWRAPRRRVRIGKPRLLWIVARHGLFG